jgi:hypothetical protein
MNPLHTLSPYFFKIHFNILGTEQDGLTGNNFDLRPEDGRLEYRQGHRLASLTFFSLFLSPYKQIPGQLYYTQRLPSPSFPIYYSLSSKLLSDLLTVLLYKYT